MNRDVYVMREVVTKLTQLLAGQGIQVTQRGVRAFVRSDPRTSKPFLVNIPYIPDNASDGLLRAIQGFLDHEVAHLLFSDFKAITKANKLGKRVASMHNIIEDTYIERCMEKKFSGSGYNLENVWRFVQNEMIAPRVQQAVASGDQQKVMSALMVPLFRAYAGQSVAKEFIKPYEETLAPLVERLKSVLEKLPACKTSWEALELAQTACEALRGEEVPEAGGSEESEDSERGEPSSRDSKPAPKDTPETGDEDKGEGAKADEDTPESDKAEGDGEDSDSEKDGEDDAAGSKKKDDEDDAEEPGAEASDDGAADDGDEDRKSGGDDGASGDDEAGEDDASDGGDPEPGAEASDDGDDDAAGADDDAGADGDEGGGESDDPAGSEGDPLDGGSDGYEGDAEGGSATDGDGAGGSDLDDIEDVLDDTPDFDEEASKAITDRTLDATRHAPYRVYTKEFDVIEPYEPKPGDYDASDLENRVRHHVGVMQKDIERMMAARSRNHWHGGRRSGRVHGAALHRLVAGHDDRVFRKKEEIKSVNTAVSLVVDFSGSMRGTKIAVACEAAYALASTLERVRIAHEVIGFTTFWGHAYGYEPWPKGYDPDAIKAESKKYGIKYSRTLPIHMPIMKNWGERLTPNVVERFAALPKDVGALCDNIDGESVEYAAMRLLSRQEERKIMIVLSDGSPMAQDSDRFVLSRHLKSVVQDCERRGIEVIGIGIIDGSVRSYYKNHVVIHSVSDLPGAVIGQLRKLL